MDVALLSLVSLLLPTLALALPTPQTDGNGVPAGGVGYDPNASGTTNQNAPGSNKDGGDAGGASGSDSSGANISTGAIAGIAAGAAVVIIICSMLYPVPNRRLQAEYGASC